MKDKFYTKACMDAYEMAMHGCHWTEKTVEKRTQDLRDMDKNKKSLTLRDKYLILVSTKHHQTTCDKNIYL